MVRLLFQRRGLLLAPSAVVAALLTLSAGAQFPPAPGTGSGLPETIEAIERARITTRILYITAHPDDESASVLTYLARGLHADVTLLSLTRGEGGQNDLGPEQAPQLGLIRTQELLAATRGYGVKLLFTRAPDFGFSKTPEETQKIWGEQVLEDMVRVIRAVRPTVVINNFGGVHGGHGHHQAAGLLTPKAVQLAADPSFKLRRVPGDEEEDTSVWGDRRPIVLLDLDRSEKPQGYILPLDDISPLYGKSWREIGTDAFANHRTQGITAFLGSPFFRRPVALKREDGGQLDPGALAEPLGPLDEDYEVGNKSVDPLMRSVDAALLAAREGVARLDYKAATEALISAARKIEQIPTPPPAAQVPAPAASLARSVKRKREKIDAALTLVAGLRLDAQADRSELVAGEDFTVRVEPHVRSGILGDFKAPGLALPGDWSVAKEESEPSGTQRFTVSVPQNAQPVHETKAGSGFKAFLPEAPPLIVASQEALLDGYTLRVTAPVMSVHATSTRADRVAPRIVPAYTLALEPKQVVEIPGKPRKPFDVLLRVHSYATRAGTVTAALDLPAGWTSSPARELKFDGVGDEYAHFQVTPPVHVVAGNLKIAAHVSNVAHASPPKEQRFSLSLEPLPTLPTQFWVEPAQVLVRAFAIEVPANLRVGYITAESEPVPEALRELGIRVELLDPAALAFGDLSSFNAIVVGVRAYELRADLPGANHRLLQYVSNGGTLVVQYQRDFAWDKTSFAPYPALISPPAPPAKEGAPAPAPRPLPRITDENSPVKFLKPDDALLNRPNKITRADFHGWVQERGLYFWTEFDPNYTPVLAMNDPGEPPLNGGLVYTHFGKGTYIYTGIAFFRQLPEGVPGAYRLFVNLLSASSAALPKGVPRSAPRKRH